MNMNKVDVICYNGLTTFESREKAYNFFQRCMFATEGAESQRYAEICYQLKYTTKPMVYDDETSIRRIERYDQEQDCLVEVKDLGKWYSYEEYKNEVEER